MKSLTFHRFGAAADVLQLETRETSAIHDGEVRVRLLASPINPADLNFIEGTYGVKPELPATGGIEGCAEVIESRSQDFAPGDRCIFLRRTGVWAEEFVIPANGLFRLPAGIDPVQAAMLKVNPGTAWRMLTGFSSLPAGSWVVQNAANSGVGHAVIQIARLLGLRTMNLVRREPLFEELKSLGADHVLLDDGDCVEAATAIIGPGRPLLALNAVGGDSALRLMNILGPGGIHVTYGAMGRRPLKVPNGLLIFKNLEIRGFWLSQWIKTASPSELQETYERLSRAMEEGRLRLPVDSTYPLSEYRAALARNQADDRNGKVLFRNG